MSTQSREQNVTFTKFSTPIAGIPPVVCPRRTRTCVFTQPPCYLAVYLISVASWIQTLKSTRSKEERLTDTHAAQHSMLVLL